MNRIETIARGVCIVDDCVLLCRGRKAGNIYLPGGHIEFGETGAFALEREMAEEAGVTALAREFLGCAEHFFVQNGNDHAEINLIFELEISGISPDRCVEAKEDWIAFDWMPICELENSTLEPASLRHLIKNWHENRGRAADRLATTRMLGAGQ